MRFTCKIELFTEGEPEIEPAFELDAMLARIKRDVAGGATTGRLRDINGTHRGSWEIRR